MGNSLPSNRHRKHQIKNSNNRQSLPTQSVASANVDTNKRTIKKATSAKALQEPTFKKVSSDEAPTQTLARAKSVEVLNFLFQIFIEKYDLHIGVNCDVCTDTIQGYRYKCLLCHDYDLCADCFESRAANRSHLSQHPMVVIADYADRTRIVELLEQFQHQRQEFLNTCSGNVHAGIQCDACKASNIRGLRIKCDDCINYDLCWSCYCDNKETLSHRKEHALVAYLLPKSTKLNLSEIKCVDGRTASGCFGSVTKVKYHDKVRALKVIKCDSRLGDSSVAMRNLDSYYNEVRAYSEIRSNCIVRFYGHGIQTASDGVQLYILMEFMEGGTLKDVIAAKKDVSVRRKLDWLLAVAKGMMRMHSKGFVHKDIKPDNVLLNGRGEAKIGDMGIAIYDGGKSYFRNSLAPRHYAAPELLLNDDGKFDKKVDSFSFGLLCNELLTYEKRTLRFPVHLPQKSPVISDLIDTCVDMEPEKRPTAKFIRDYFDSLLKKFWFSVADKSNYTTLNTTEKDKIFMKFYESYRPVN